MTESGAATNFRSPVLAEPLLMPPVAGGGGSNFGIPFGTGSDPILRTPAGNVRSVAPPPLPMAPTSMNAYGNGYGAGYNNGFGNYGGYSGYGAFSGYGGYGNFNRFGVPSGINPMDQESRFIQLAEASSRPAFESIESLVSAVGNIASMLDSTFFALTSSFRAILGVAANFGRLRGVFAQFWSTFAIFRGLSWIYRKILYWLHISKLDPSSKTFKKAFAEAIEETSAQQRFPQLPRKGQSPWPVLAFLSFIFTAPYLIMKLLGTVTKTAQEEARNPDKWIQPIESVALYNFQARNSTELTIRAGQRVIIAPKEIQNTLALLHTGWAMATTDGQTTGIIPINYVKSPQQMRQEQLSKPPADVQTLNSEPTHISTTAVVATQPKQIDLSASAFAAPSAQKEVDQKIPDFEIAPQPIGPPASENVVVLE